MRPRGGHHETLRTFSSNYDKTTSTIIMPLLTPFSPLLICSRVLGGERVDVQ